MVYATRIIDHFRLGISLFGSELDGTRVDKTELLHYALETSGADRKRAIMIGDGRHDVVGARNNGMTAIGVLYGYGSEAELVDASAHRLCASPRQVPESIGQAARAQAEL
jgi:phosphoglycolate phosphatase